MHGHKVNEHLSEISIQEKLISFMHYLVFSIDLSFPVWATLIFILFAEDDVVMKVVTTPQEIQIS